MTEEINVKTSSGNVFADLADNGVIHIIDQVLMPALVVAE